VKINKKLLEERKKLFLQLSSSKSDKKQLKKEMASMPEEFVYRWLRLMEYQGLFDELRIKNGLPKRQPVATIRINLGSTVQYARRPAIENYE